MPNTKHPFNERARKDLILSLTSVLVNKVLTQKNTVEGKMSSGSSTAGFVTFFRACSYKEMEKRFRGPDYLAELFHFGRDRLFLHLSFLMLPIVRRMLPGTYEWVVARTFFLDDQFRGPLEENYDQIINLGAGFDSQSYRFADMIGDTVVFELDLPEPQRIKRELLEERGVLIPDNLRYVPIDFNTDDLLEKLKDAGFQEDKRNLFIWEGVTEYLTEEAIDSTLAFIKHHSGKGTRIAFTYIYRSAVEDRKTFYGSKEIVDRVAKNGEPYQYGIKENEIESFLTERGYSLVSHHTAEDLEKKYLTASDGKLYGRICGHNNIVVAEVMLG